jgi:hypothetical protein
MIKLFFAIVLLIIAMIGLSYDIFILNQNYPFFSELIFQMLQMLGCYMLVGIGIGFPFVFLSSAMGWIHLLLLLSGNIDPHLTGAGFFKVLNTLFSKI